MDLKSKRMKTMFKICVYKQCIINIKCIYMQWFFENHFDSNNVFILSEKQRKKITMQYVLVKIS